MDRIPAAGNADTFSVHAVHAGLQGSLRQRSIISPVVLSIRLSKLHMCHRSSAVGRVEILHVRPSRCCTYLLQNVRLFFSSIHTLMVRLYCQYI
jgi:hypothetical protein